MKADSRYGAPRNPASISLFDEANDAAIPEQKPPLNAAPLLVTCAGSVNPVQGRGRGRPRNIMGGTTQQKIPKARKVPAAIPTTSKVPAAKHGHPPVPPPVTVAQQRVISVTPGTPLDPSVQPTVVFATSHPTLKRKVPSPNISYNAQHSRVTTQGELLPVSVRTTNVGSTVSNHYPVTTYQPIKTTYQRRFQPIAPYPSTTKPNQKGALSTFPNGREHVYTLVGASELMGPDVKPVKSEESKIDQLSPISSPSPGLMDIVEGRLIEAPPSDHCYAKLQWGRHKAIPPPPLLYERQPKISPPVCRNNQPRILMRAHRTSSPTPTSFTRPPSRQCSTSFFAIRPKPVTPSIVSRENFNAALQRTHSAGLAVKSVVARSLAESDSPSNSENVGTQTPIDNGTPVQYYVYNDLSCSSGDYQLSPQERSSSSGDIPEDQAQYDDYSEYLDDSPTVARLGSRADNSLLILTQKFLDLLVENKVVNLNDAAAILQVPKRRLYDITNVLDGIDVVNKTGKNSISLKNPANIKQSVDRARAMINQDINSTDPLLSAAARPAERSQHSAALAAERARGRELDRVLNDVNRAINLVKESPVDRTHCYLSYDEIRQQVNIPSPVLVAVKPPSGTTTDITVSSFAETGKHAALFKNKEGQALTLWGIGGAAPAMNAAPPVVQPVQMPTAASQQVKQEYCDFAVPYPPQSELYQPQAQQASAPVYPQPTLNTLNMDMQPLRTEDFSPMRMQSFTYDNPAMPSTSFMGNDMSNQLQPFNYDDMASFRNGNDVVLPTASNGSFNVPIITPSKLLPLGTSSLLISPLKTLIETETPGANIIAHGFNSFDEQSMMPSITLGDIYEESMWSMNNPLHLG